MANVWPTLNGNGYVKDVPTMIDEAIGATLLARSRFSEIYHDHISSFETEMRKNKDNPDALAQGLEEMYKTMFERLFDQVSVQVNVLDPEPNTVNYPITIGILVTHNGVSYDAAFELTTREGAAKAAAGAINGTKRTIL